jgi:hypothetical protein
VRVSEPHPFAGQTIEMWRRYAAARVEGTYISIPEVVRKHDYDVRRAWLAGGVSSEGEIRNSEERQAHGGENSTARSSRSATQIAQP